MANPFERDHEDPRGGIDLDQQVMGDFPEHAGKGARRETRTRLVWNVIVHWFCFWFCLFGFPPRYAGIVKSGLGAWVGAKAGPDGGDNRVHARWITNDVV